MPIHQKILNWTVWFFTANMLLFMIIGLNYLSATAWFDTSYLLPRGRKVLELFVFVSYIGQFGLLSLVPYLFLAPFILLFPKRNFIFTLAISISTLMLFALIIDIVIYKLYRFHFYGIILDFLLHGWGTEILGLSLREWLLSATLITGVIAGEILLARFIWKRFAKRNPALLKWLGIVIGLCLYLSYMMIAFSDKYLINRMMIDTARFLPFYTEILDTIPVKKNYVDKQAEVYLVQPRKMNGELNYPLQPLQFKSEAHLKNLVIIVIDTWRFDMLNAELMPNLYAFAQKSWTFTNHFSGGNSTGPGIFSLFYGLPATYWTATESHMQGPVLIEELLNRHYDMGIFASEGVKYPTFDRNVFSALKNFDPAMQPGANSYERDLNVTKKFSQFLNERQTSKPFFSFLFYEGVHGYCDYANDLQPLQPAIQDCNRYGFTQNTDPIPYLNRYKNAVMLADQEVKQVINLLKSKKLLENTVVIITGDHGEEFNDNHQGYWGHAGNFTRYQIQTPLVVFWPDEKPQIFTHQTSHFDIVPTLMNRLFGCANNEQDYSVGAQLLDQKKRQYLVVGSYISFGVVEPERVTIVQNSGNYQIQQIDGKTIHDAALNSNTILAFQEIRRFFKK